MKNKEWKYILKNDSKLEKINISIKEKNNETDEELQHRAYNILSQILGDNEISRDNTKGWYIDNAEQKTKTEMLKEAIQNEANYIDSVINNRLLEILDKLDIEPNTTNIKYARTELFRKIY